MSIAVTDNAVTTANAVTTFDSCESGQLHSELQRLTRTPDNILWWTQLAPLLDQIIAYSKTRAAEGHPQAQQLADTARQTRLNVAQWAGDSSKYRSVMYQLQRLAQQLQR